MASVQGLAHNYVCKNDTIIVIFTSYCKGVFTIYAGLPLLNHFSLSFHLDIRPITNTDISQTQLLKLISLPGY